MSWNSLELRALSAPVWLEFEPVGRSFETGDSRRHGESAKSRDDQSSDSDSETEQVNPLLLDPTQWKDQDHYSILGLGKLRYRAKPEDIRKAYRQKVLQYHPDKQQSVADSQDSDHFRCIKIAYDILSDPKCRRAYDSVDSVFGDEVPSINEHVKAHFFEVFGPIFEANARWSTVQPVPYLGDENSSIEDVTACYDFWYNFSSWRDFSYQDEHRLDKAESREEKRWMEKQNKAARQKRKREEMARIRLLVDNAYACDPRIKKFKETEKAERLARKKAREEAQRLEAEQREKERQERVAEERKQVELEQEEARLQAMQAKKEREAVKNALKKARKNFRTACKALNYFSVGEGDLVSKMEQTEKLSATLTAERLQELSDHFATLSLAEAKSMFEHEMSILEKQERAAAEEQAKLASGNPNKSAASTADIDWTQAEVQLLIKAVVLYPAGTQKRWEVITNFINAHSPDDCAKKVEKQVISKVKSLQRMDATEREAENKMAYTKFVKDHVTKGHVEAPPTQRYDGPKPWTGEEQKLLEDALRTHPSTLADRWDKISAAVGTRTKAECISRCKELAARVKAKKQGT